MSSDLAEFPRPSVAVDVAVLTVLPADGGQSRGALGLAMLLWRRTGSTETGKWGLPGSFLRDRERLAAAVTRTLRDKCGISGLAPRQLGVLDDPTRDDRGWVLSVAHLDVAPVTALAERRPDNEVRLAPVRPPSGTKTRRSGSVLALPDGQGRLPFDHEAIVKMALEDLRTRYRDRPDPSHLLAAPFTLRQLRLVHEAVQGSPLQKDTFRRAMLPFLDDAGGHDAGSLGRPALLYTVRPPAGYGR